MHQDAGYRKRERNQPPRSALSPLQAFILLASLALVAGVFLATRGSGPPAEAAASRPQVAPSSSAVATPAPSPTPQGTPTAAPLSPAEATAEFSRLRHLLDRVYASRNLAGINEFAVPGSPAARQAASQIRFLRRHSLLDRTKTTTKRLEVEMASVDEVQLEQSVVIRPRFLDDATGLEADFNLPTQRATLLWTIRRTSVGWRIYSATPL